MSNFEKIMAIINVIAIIAIPIVAVFVGQHLQNRSQQRKDKLEIFKILMMNRVGWSVESVHAMNIIDIVFVKDKNVRGTWKDYYTMLCIQDPNDMQKQQIQTAQHKLLEAMAKSLGYKDQITWETIQNPYIPKGMIDAMQQQQTIQLGQEKWAGAMDMVTKMIGKGPLFQQPVEQEDTHHADA